MSDAPKKLPSKSSGRGDPRVSRPPAKKKSRLDEGDDGGVDADDYGGNNATTLPLDALTVVMEFLPPKVRRDCR